MAKHPLSLDRKDPKVIEAARLRGIAVTNEHIEMMAAAYFQKTDVDPEEVELVQEQKLTEDGRYKMVWYFQRRKRNRHPSKENPEEDLA